MSVFMLNTTDTARQLREAYESNDTKKVEAAWEAAQQAVANQVQQSMAKDLREYQRTQDRQVLAQRGYRTLTAREEKWYQKVITALKGSTPKQSFIEIINSNDEEDIMPSTIFEDVFRNLEQEHPLLKNINMQPVGYLTKWIRNKRSAQTAVWGPITAAVEKEITGGLDVVDVKQNKLSCFAILELGMLDLGPIFLDRYIRACIGEAMACALEMAFVCGNGVNQPIGADRDLSSDYSPSTGWKQKTPVAVTSFAPAAYGALLSTLAKDEDGNSRSFSKVAIICNLTDYLTKIMPATTVMTAGGTYANNLFPFPTDVIVSNFVSDNKPLLGLMDEYTMYVGQSRRNNVIEYDDSVKFLEDQRVFKVVNYADGRASDNTCFILLDITNLDPAYITVYQMNQAVETA